MQESPKNEKHFRVQRRVTLVLAQQVLMKSIYNQMNNTGQMTIWHLVGLFAWGRTLSFPTFRIFL